MKNNKVTIREVYNLIHELRDDIKETYVTKTEFSLVRSIVFGMVGLTLLTVFTAILAGVVKALL